MCRRQLVACSADVDKTFTVGFDNGEKYNEISYAKELSELIPDVYKRQVQGCGALLL